MKSTGKLRDREPEQCVSCGLSLKPEDQYELHGQVYCAECYTEAEEMEDLFLLEDQF